MPSEGHIGTAAWYYIDKTGKKAFAQEFRHAGQFNEGLAPVETDAGWGFINTSGTTVIKPQFKATEYFDFTKYLSEYQGFHDGLAAVVDAGGKVGYIDQTGKFVVQPQFVIGNGFAGGFAYAYPPSPTAFTEPAPENPHWYGPLSIIDVTGRTIYQAPTAP